jgi:hypothetical protein
MQANRHPKFKSGDMNKLVAALTEWQLANKDAIESLEPTKKLAVTKALDFLNAKYQITDVPKIEAEESFDFEAELELPEDIDLGDVEIEDFDLEGDIELDDLELDEDDLSLIDFEDEQQSEQEIKVGDAVELNHFLDGVRTYLVGKQGLVAGIEDDLYAVELYPFGRLYMSERALNKIPKVKVKQVMDVEIQRIFKSYDDLKKHLVTLQDKVSDVFLEFIFEDKSFARLNIPIGKGKGQFDASKETLDEYALDNIIKSFDTPNFESIFNFQDQVTQPLVMPIVEDRVSPWKRSLTEFVSIEKTN